MEEKYMVNDVLECNKSEIMLFTNCFITSENIELKQTFTQLRSNLEAFHSELFTLATSKGYYTATIKEKPENITRNKKSFSVKKHSAGIFYFLHRTL